MAKKMDQIDYVCKVGERVLCPRLAGPAYEATIIEWNDNIATVKLDDGTIKEIEC